MEEWHACPQTKEGLRVWEGSEKGEGSDVSFSLVVKISEMQYIYAVLQYFGQVLKIFEASVVCRIVGKVVLGAGDVGVKSQLSTKWTSHTRNNNNSMGSVKTCQNIFANYVNLLACCSV